MFLDTPDLECLRQGDILVSIPFPLLDSKQISFIGVIEEHTDYEVPTLAVSRRPHRSDPNWLTAQLPVKMSFVSIVSHCCRLELRAGKRVTVPTISVARLRPVPEAIANDEQRLDALKANKDPRDPTDPGIVDYFYIPKHKGLIDRDWIVDFNQVFCLPSSDYDTILKRKVLQLNDEFRVKFKMKLGVALSRLTDEEIQAGLQNPWVPKQSSLFGKAAKPQ